MEFNIKISDSSKKVVAGINNLPTASINGMRQGLYVVGKFLVKKTSSNILHTTKSGRYYKYKGRNYRASAPGEYPANRSGANRRSVQFIVKGKKKMIFGANAKYSKHVEKSRPFLIRTIRETTGTQKKLITNQMKRFVENAHK